MNILIVGDGGREHALAWKIQQSPLIENIYGAPANPGMEREGVTPVSGETTEELAAFAQRNAVDLTIVGPEAPLCDGVVDDFRARGLSILGPTKAAAQLEGSKGFAKRFMKRHGIPTAHNELFTTREPALDYIKRHGAPIVVKADGLAAGKGVTVARDEQTAVDAVEQCFEGAFGDAGKQVVLEECLQGTEASIVALTDGKSILPLASSQDYKRIGTGDTGPNTGGMGAVSPAPVVTDNVWHEIERRVLQPFVHGCREEGLDYRGIIYAGIIVDQEDINVLEFNVRFGDPETQAVLPRLRDDLVPALTAAEQQRLSEISLNWEEKAALCVVLASEGYPGKYRKGCEIMGIDQAEAQGAVVFQAGTQEDDHRLLTAGGRVIGVTALGETMEQARQRVYSSVTSISWDGMYYRDDIGQM